MTRVTDQEWMWRALFQEHHASLAQAVEMILYRRGTPAEILKTALTELKGRPFYEPFGLVSAVRAVVKAAIAYNYTHIGPEITLGAQTSASDGQIMAESWETLPWTERAAYFLREVLHYSRRDVALLLGISDANVDQLNRFAKKRIGIPTDAIIHPHETMMSPFQAMGSGHSMAFGAFE